MKIVVQAYDYYCGQRTDTAMIRFDGNYYELFILYLYGLSFSSYNSYYIELHYIHNIMLHNFTLYYIILQYAKLYIILHNTTLYIILHNITVDIILHNIFNINHFYTFIIRITTTYSLIDHFDRKARFIIFVKPPAVVLLLHAKFVLQTWHFCLLMFSIYTWSVSIFTIKLLWRNGICSKC